MRNPYQARRTREKRVVAGASCDARNPEARSAAVADWAFLWQSVGGRWWALEGSAAAALLSAAAKVGVPYLVGKAVNAGLDAHATGLLVTLCVAIAVLGVLQAVGS